MYLSSHQICTRHQLVRLSRFCDFSLDQVEQFEGELVLLVVQDRVQMSGCQQLIQELEHWQRDSVNLKNTQHIIFSLI